LFRLTAPLDDEVRRFIANQEHAGLSYPEVGASADTVPDGYNVDHNRIELGRGERVWQRAVAAVRAWQMFNIPWLRLYWPETPIQVGAIVAVSVRHFGFFSLNACRIVYVVDEDGVVTNAPVSRFGFAYGTLGEHAESGEYGSKIPFHMRVPFMDVVVVIVFTVSENRPPDFHCHKFGSRSYWRLASSRAGRRRLRRG